MNISFVSIAGNDEQGWDVIKVSVKATENTIKETIYPIDFCNKDSQIAEEAAAEFAKRKKIAYILNTETVYTVMKIRGLYHLYKLPPNDQSTSTMTKATSINGAIEEVRKRAMSQRAIFIEPRFKRVRQNNYRDVYTAHE